MIPQVQRLLIAGLLCTLAGCGWHLRGFSHNPLPEELALIAPSRLDPMTLAVREAMRERAIELDGDAPWRLILGEELLNKRIVAVTSIGSPSQYELTLMVNFRYVPNEVSQEEAEATEAYLPKTLSATRVYDFDPADTVAKSEEQGVLVEEMRQELAHRLLGMAPSRG